MTRTRGIPMPAGGWPEAVRFHQGRQALILAATDDTGAVRAVQAVFLDAEARKRLDKPAPDGEQKRSYGAFAGSGTVVRLTARPQQDEPAEQRSAVTGAAVRWLQLAEGPETALSVWAATGVETWVALGSIAKILPPDGATLLVCADDDPHHHPAAKTLRKGIATWQAAGHQIAIAWPWAERRGDKSDLNDTLQRDGMAAVQSRLAAARADVETPAPTIHRVPLSEARVRLTEALDRFMVAAGAWTPPQEGGDTEAADEPAMPPPVHAIRVGVGIGKSENARRMIARELAAMRHRGDLRTAALAVPTHALGDEQARRFEALPESRANGLSAAVWRGRRAPDPQAPGFAMCRNLEAVADAQAVGATVQTSVCRQVRRDKDSGERTEILCPFFDECGYQRQAVQRPDLMIVPHELIYSQKPKAIGNLAFLVVDEAAWQDGLEGVSGRGITLSLEALRPTVSIPGDRQGIDTARIRDVHQRVSMALCTLQDGPLRRDAMLAADILDCTAADGVALTWRRKADPDLRPDMTPADRKAAVAEVAENATVMKLGRFFAALGKLVASDGPEASGWIALETQPTDAGPQRIVRLRGRRSLAKGWLVPTIHLDATLDPLLLRPYWPQVEVTAEIEAEAPWMRILQLTGRDLPKSRLVVDEFCAGDEVEEGRREYNARAALAVALAAVRSHGGRKGLIVAQQAVKAVWRDECAVPTYVDLAHHNAVAGRDEWRNVASLVVVGRTMPRTGDVERMAGALTGAAVSNPVEGRLPRVPVCIELNDGTTRVVETEQHPDPVAEAIRRQICEGELVQITGRGRGVNRTSANALNVLILTDRPIPLPVELVTWEALAPSPADLMLAIGGVALASPTDAARAYNAVWNTPSASKMAWQRHRAASGEPPALTAPLVRATYRREGPGCKPAVLAYDPSAVPDLLAWLTLHVGAIAELTIDVPPEQPQPSHQEHEEAGAEASRERQIAIPHRGPQPLTEIELRAASSHQPAKGAIGPPHWPPI
uniref:toprim domain-containing protein n=1 Tax=Belnapia rosea TaxID=938405 RepID=UPI0015A4DEAC|nr:toprim domain-containing protein [Belnapia rosea]